MKKLLAIMGKDRKNQESNSWGGFLRNREDCGPSNTGQ